MHSTQFESAINPQERIESANAFPPALSYAFQHIVSMFFTTLLVYVSLQLSNQPQRTVPCTPRYSIWDLAGQ